jgi:hypothetical protein
MSLSVRSFRRSVKYRLAATFVAVALLTLAVSGVALAVAPVKLVPAGSIRGGFIFVKAVAVDNDPASPDYDDVYVADKGNQRVQQFTAAGVFVSMFGWEVNATKDREPAATQSEKDICTAVSHDTCAAGVEGSSPGQMDTPTSIAIDPASGNVYLAEIISSEQGIADRVQEFTEEGRFVSEIGREVNATKKANLCTEEEVEKSGVVCVAPAQQPVGSSEHGSFNMPQGDGNLLTIGGPEDRLYVGDEQRVQEFKTDGEWIGEVSLTSISSEPESYVDALAVDDTTGDVYLVYSASATGAGDNRVREFDAGGVELASFQVSPREERGEMQGIVGMALSPSGDLALVAYENNVMRGGANQAVGMLYDAPDGRLLTEFTIPQESFVFALAFNNEGDAYGAGEVAGEGEEVLVFGSDPVGELLTGAGSCKLGPERDTSVTFDCSLNGETNPEGVSETEVLFEWGKSPQLGETTTAQQVAETEPVSASIEARPDQTFYYRLEGHDQNVKAPEKLTSETNSVATPPVPPRVLGTPSVAFVSSSSAVLLGEVNPENAGTTYRFQYGACETLKRCPGIGETPTGESGAYGSTGVSLEARGLQPATTYRDRLVAVNKAGEPAVSGTGSQAIPEGTFTTSPAPAPAAATGTASAVGATTATISGSVEPDGQPTSYSFEVGLDEGAATRYGVVSSGSVGASSVPVEESLELTGLQPGSTYAFRIAVHSGYIDNASTTLTGASVLFTTAGLPAVLTAPTPLVQLAIPSIAFPKAQSATKSKKPKGKLKVEAKRKQKKHTSKHRTSGHKSSRAGRR